MSNQTRNPKSKKYISKRVEQVMRVVGDLGVDAVLITNPKNCFYLSGYYEESGFMLVSKTKSFYFSGNLSFDEASGVVQCSEVIRLLDKTQLKSCLDREGVKKLGFESSFMTVQKLGVLREDLGDVEFVETTNLVEEIRHIKDDLEISLIKKAVEISCEVFGEIEKKIDSYKHENDIAFDYEFEVRKRGADGLSFPMIVANGVSSAIPHYSKLDNKIDHTKLTLMDFGCEYNGYGSDHTRVHMPLDPTKKEKEVYFLVEQAKQLAIDEVKPGVDAVLIDQKVRDFFKKYDMDKYFVHTLGHSVGIDVHDGLVLSHKKPLILKENMVITIEPGLYFPGEFGVRLEDMVVVKGERCEVLE